MRTVAGKTAGQQGAIAGRISCPNCAEQVSELLRHCPSCEQDCGAPNVRIARDHAESSELQNRFDYGKREAAARGCDEPFIRFIDAVQQHSRIVVAIPALNARQMLEQPSMIYMNQETLVGSGARVPAEFANDTHRGVVASTLFGSAAGEIRYGVLSFDGYGLWNYGDVLFTLKDVSVKDRVSFLEENSYTFVEKHSLGALPPGYRSDWDARHQLAGAKLHAKIQQNSSDADFPDLLLESGKDRQSDRFIEAHIYRGFNSRAIDNVHCKNDSPLTRAQRIDFEVIKEEFKKLSPSRNSP